MADSWEDYDQVQTSAPAQRHGFNFNPNAQPFTFNPNASSFVPHFGQQPPPPPTHGFPPPPPPPQAFQSPPPPAQHMQPEASSPAVEAVSMEVQNGTPEANGADEELLPEAPAAEAAPDGAADVAQATDILKELKVDEAKEEILEERTEEVRRKEILEELAKEDPREHLNIVFIGHVDAGKSTTAGQILYLTGGVDERTIEKYEREAKDKNRESWYMAYIMDTNEEERAKGKTVEVGRACFETTKKRYTILDAPGHHMFVPNMISGASQADVGVLVVSARKGEFEAGFERGGQTREHAQLAKTLGVSKLVVVINKMDDPSMAGPNGEWSNTRYSEIIDNLTKFLRKECGYNPKKDLIFLPISGLLGKNLKERVDPKLCPWYDGPTLFEVLDGIESQNRDPLAPFRMPIIDRYRDMGTIVMGKSESGVVQKGDTLYVMPNRVTVKVGAIFRDDAEVSIARAGENLRLRLSGIEEEEVSTGFVVSSRAQPVPVVKSFEAQLQVLELLEHKAIFSAGYKAILHIHSVVEECEVKKIIAEIDPKTQQETKSKFVKNGAVVRCKIGVEKSICVERFDQVPQLGRFTLRDEGKTIARGKVITLPPKSVKN